MSNTKPTIPSGTRDFTPSEVARRNYIINILKESFVLYGFEPIETPTFENLTTLLGKYGEEGDKLIYKIIESGDFINNKDVLDFITKELSQKLIENLRNTTSNEYKIHSFETFLRLKFEEKQSEFNLFDFRNFNRDITENSNNINQTKPQLLNSLKIASKIAKKGLRYDLTVPLARFVVMNSSKISSPFKRYQIQNVFRADKAQKGRYREFTQCDADVVGSKSLIVEAEFIKLIDTVFKQLDLNVTLHINNRKLLSGIAESVGKKDDMLNIAIAIDKFEKIGVEGVKQELANKNYNIYVIDKIIDICLMNQNPTQNLNNSAASDAWNLSQNLTQFLNSVDYLQNDNFFPKNEDFTNGLQELKKIAEYLNSYQFKSTRVKLNLSLARGLDYYTGTIFEVTSNDYQIGSILGGGRYDDLTKHFGQGNTPGMGISFGLDRIYDVLTATNKFPENLLNGPSILFITKSSNDDLIALKLMDKFRMNSISVEIYPDTSADFGKKKNYAKLKNINYYAVIGDSLFPNAIVLYNTHSNTKKVFETQEELLNLFLSKNNFQ